MKFTASHWSIMTLNVQFARSIALMGAERKVTHGNRYA